MTDERAEMASCEARPVSLHLFTLAPNARLKAVLAPRGLGGSDG